MARNIDPIYMVIVVIDNLRNLKYLLVESLKDRPSDISICKYCFWLILINSNLVILSIKAKSYCNTNNSIIVLLNKIKIEVNNNYNN